MSDAPPVRAPAAAARMATAAEAFLAALPSGQRAAAHFPFPGEERYRWTYLPGPRPGVPLADMSRRARTAAFALLDAGVGARAAAEARAIMALERVLGEAERQAGRSDSGRRDPERFYWAIFGSPRGDAPWEWRVGGHHVGVHVTVVGRELIAPTPFFLGANPAEVRHGPSRGVRTLAAEEDLARALLHRLAPERRAIAVVDATAPPDILTRNYRRAEPGAAPSGLVYAAMEGDERELLLRLVHHYVERTAAEAAAGAWRRIEAAGLEAIGFAWAGAVERGGGHYYAVKGPTFLIEYDNTQNDANHIHTVWRDFTGDWGDDLLADHYASDH